MSMVYAESYRPRKLDFPEIRRVLYKRQKGICPYCQKQMRLPVDSKTLFRGNIATIDHVIPLAHGGKDEIENFVAACYDCNHKKADKLFKEGEFIEVTKSKATIEFVYTAETTQAPYTQPQYIYYVLPCYRKVMMQERGSRKPIYSLSYTPPTLFSLAKYSGVKSANTKDRPIATIEKKKKSREDSYYYRLLDSEGKVVISSIDLDELKLIAGKKGYVFREEINIESTN